MRLRIEYQGNTLFDEDLYMVALKLLHDDRFGFGGDEKKLRVSVSDWSGSAKIIERPAALDDET